MNPKVKTSIVFILDAALSVCAFYSSLALRYSDFHINAVPIAIFFQSCLLLTLIQVCCFWFMGFYKGIWRFASTPDLFRLIKGITIAVSLSFAGIFLLNRMVGIPRSTFIIDWLLLLTFLGGMRFTYRIWRDNFWYQYNEALQKVIIVGAGAGGSQLFRELRESRNLQMKVVAFVDDDPSKYHKILHGVSIMGKIADLPAIIQKTDATKIFIAIPSANGDQIQNIVESCKNTELEFKTLPSMSEIINGKSELSQLRNIEIEDLLGRKEVVLNDDSVQAMVANKVVLITGAGGSIGSEICNQLVKYKPERLILFEMTEFFLYELENNLRKKYPTLDIIPIIGDVRNKEKVHRVFAKYLPQVVLHAAAYKHVPIMEDNPAEAVKTNIFGTKVVAEAAVAHAVERFVLISTDKAVNPTNVMGATKRVAELVCQLVQQNQKTKFMTVRFGNVLGSSGSVIPLFKQQLKSGGPITITHPDIIRYFMSIPEACRLVLQAAALGRGGEIFVLDMGAPVKIVDLAKQMIRLAGLKLGTDIDIQYTGLRPGEKLYEELFVTNENTTTTEHPMVKMARPNSPNIDITTLLANLFKQIEGASETDVKLALKTLVPEYFPHGLSIDKDFQKNEKDEEQLH